jgi:hypothetical protein
VAKTKGIVQAEEAQLVLGRPVRSNPYSIAMKAVALFLPALAVLELVQKLRGIV